MSENPIRLDYQGELMNNYASLVAVGGGKEFRTLMDEENHPLIFSIGSDGGRLHIICQGEDSSAPWNLTSLTAGPVHTFAVAQNPESGEIRVAYATFDGQRSRLYYSRPRNNDRTALRTVSAFEWIEHSLQRSDLEVDRIEIDFEHIMFSCRSGNREAAYYAARFDGPITKFELPQLADEINDFKVGSYPRRSGAIRGTYLLYTIKGVRKLLFQSFPGPDPDEPITQKAFGVSGRPESIELIRKTDGKDQLLACGDSVCLYTTSEAEAQLLIKSRGSSFDNIQVTQHDGHCSIWVSETVNQKSRLLFLTDRYFDADRQSFKPEQQWTPDLPFMQNVRQFSCINGSSNGNHLILIDDKDRVSHLYQDPLTTLWRQDAIAIESPGVREFPCYTTRFILYNGQEGPSLAGKSCYLSASSQVNVTINGIAYRLDSQNPVEVNTDVMGAVTIIGPVEDDISTPIFYVGYDEHQPSHILNPSHMVEDRLRNIKTADAFKAARADEDKPLWKSGETPEDKDLGDAANIIQHLLDCKQDMLNDELAKLTGVKVAKPAEGDEPEIWGAHFGANGRVRYLDNDSAKKLLADDQKADEETHKGFHPIRWIGHAIGTVIHGIKSFFGELRSFVVQKINDVTTFILNLAGEVVRFVIDTLEKVFPFLKAVFDAIGLVFKTLLHWLGQLLGWKDIWATHKMIARMTKNGAKSIEMHIDQTIKGWKLAAHEYVENLRDDLRRIEDSDLPDDGDTHRNILTHLLVSPLFSWPMYMLQHSGILKKTVDLATGTIEKLDGLVAKQAKEYEYVAEFVHDQMAEIIKFAAHPGFSSRKLLQLFGPLLDRILDGVDQLIELIQGLLEFAAGAVAKLEEGFDDPASIPFVSPMYKFITGMLGEKEEFSFLNGISLMISVPFTILCRLSSGGKGKPFEPVTDGFGEPGMFEDFWSAAPGAQPAGRTVDSSVQESPGKSDEAIYQYQQWGGMVGSLFGTFGEIFSMDKNELGTNYFVMVLNGVAHASTIPVVTATGRDTPERRKASDLRWAQFAMSLIPAYVLAFEKLPGSAKAKSIVNMVISAACLGTNIGANVLDGPGGLSWFGQMSFRAGSLILGAGELSKNPEVSLASFPCIVAGGASSLMNACPMADYNRSSGTYN